MLGCATILESKGQIIEGPYETCELDPEGTREPWEVLSQSDLGYFKGRETGRTELLWHGLGQRPM